MSRSTQKPTSATRRAFIPSASVAAATMAPAAALSEFAPSMAGDAELLALAPQFDPIYEEWRANRLARPKINPDFVWE